MKKVLGCYQAACKVMPNLYVVATPIGNLNDLSSRAIEILKSVDLIACEDTRHSKKLLQNFLINTPCTSLHEHNEREIVAKLVERLLNGESIALISDAGTPLISDPGYRLVHEALAANVDVSPIPGACAAIAALSVSGLPSDRFSFEGFLPAKQVARLKRLQQLEGYLHTLIFYESPHRIEDCVEDMLKVFGAGRRVVLARELTKMYETIVATDLGDLNQQVKSNSDFKRGEIVVLLEGKPSENIDDAMQEAMRVYAILAKELPMKQAVALAAKVTGVKKNALYKVAL